jgi:subtilisin family serine protease
VSRQARLLIGTHVAGTVADRVQSPCGLVDIFTCVDYRVDYTTPGSAIRHAVVRAGEGYVGDIPYTISQTDSTVPVVYDPRDPDDYLVVGTGAPGGWWAVLLGAIGVAGVALIFRYGEDL